MINNVDFIKSFIDFEFPIVMNKDVEYINLPCGFDIETTSFLDHGEKRGVMYHWQFGLVNKVTSGRTWKELKTFLNILHKIFNTEFNVRHLVVYVHNLPFEFQWMRHWFDWEKVFFIDERKILYGVTSEGIEFRCSYKLSNKSLAETAKDTVKYPIRKMTGDLDYSLTRTPLTPLTDEELKYCENDIRVILQYIQEKIEYDGDITKIPLTNTGYVRNYCRSESFKSYKTYKKLMKELRIESADDYYLMKSCFQGGFTHASAIKVHRVFKNVASLDFASSYPYVMLSELFPMSVLHKPDISKEFSSLEPEEVEEALEEKYLEQKCCLMEVKFYNFVETVGYDHPLSESKCVPGESKGMVIDNGRVVQAEYVTTFITEQDWFTYKAFYKWKTFEIRDFGYFDRGYLPKPIVKSILHFYKMKTTLKGVAGEEVSYMVYKNMLNSTYGMMVTSPLRDIIEFSQTRPEGYIKKEPDGDAAIEKYNNNYNRFLYYAWGVWVTAYARANLFSGILACGKDYIYSDTDSVKITNYEEHKEYFDNYNAVVVGKLEMAAKHHRINFDEFKPKNKLMGVWDFEGIYTHFKTLGAKRYLYDIGGCFHLTVAGVNKEMACKYLTLFSEDENVLIINEDSKCRDCKSDTKVSWIRPDEDSVMKVYKAFTDSLTIPPDASGRVDAQYIDEETRGTLVDYNGVEYQYHEYSSINMTETEYTLEVAGEFVSYCYKIAKQLHEVMIHG